MGYSASGSSDVSVLPPAPPSADRDILIARVLVSAGYGRGKAKVQFAVATGGASGLPLFTDGLLRNYGGRPLERWI
jgi:hypothetical protein